MVQKTLQYYYFNDPTRQTQVITQVYKDLSSVSFPANMINFQGVISLDLQHI